YPLAPVTPLAPLGPSAPLGPPAPPLTFRLGGLSKSAGLPQVKLGWIAAAGPESVVADALRRLEVICDTYLSVSTPVQSAASELIDGGAAVRAAILDRIRRNHAALAQAIPPDSCTELLRSDAGWSAVLRVPSSVPEEHLVLRLLEEDDVLVHPGYFFDFPHEAFLVLSLLPPVSEFDEGVRRVLRRLHG
ncbi:MAG: aminotransferase class I/II-fold pyridoxal phosphate-dependent enzyme, partial [Acidobacteria bacterium]|nr:aminotransferase class I/II-fold pyridoxal phosphate-dependent enzyme [Acidobacteriota bacterium]